MTRSLIIISYPAGNVFRRQRSSHNSNSIRGLGAPQGILSEKASWIEWMQVRGSSSGCGTERKDGGAESRGSGRRTWILGGITCFWPTGRKERISTYGPGSKEWRSERMRSRISPDRGALRHRSDECGAERTNRRAERSGAGGDRLGS